MKKAVVATRCSTALGWRWNSLCVAIVLGVLPGSGLLAAPVVETLDGLEVNWSSQVVRFTGDASPEPQDAGSMKPAERRARSVAVQNARARFPRLVERAQSANQSSRSEFNEAGKPFAESRSWNTTYFGDGRVRVHLEQSLAKLMSPLVTAGSQFPQTSVRGEAGASGVILRLPKTIPARAVWELHDDAGRVAFSAATMSSDAFREGLMGRWFRRPSTAELAQFVGENPLEIKISVVESDGRFVVPAGVWQSMSESSTQLMAAGRMVLALP